MNLKIDGQDLMNRFILERRPGQCFSTSALDVLKSFKSNKALKAFGNLLMFLRTRF